MNTELNQEQKRVKINEAMGWTRHAVTKEDPYTCTRCGAHYSPSIWREWEVAYLWCSRDGASAPPGYFGDANAALTLCDAVAREGWDVTFWKSSASSVWLVRLESGAGFTFQVETGVAPTLPAAICEAFGKAKGLW